jgi:hypothetical protein
VSAHPSMLQLDAMSLGRGDENTAAHVHGCARCAAHVARVQQALPVPAWLRELDPSQRRRPRRWSWLYRFSLVAAVVLIAFGGGVLLRAKPWNTDRFDRGAKGTPSIAVYIKRHGAVSLWDGQAPVQAGDAVQLKVAAEGYSRVTVSALQEGTLTQLYAGPAAGEGLLPRSWTVDEAPGPEVLLVAFSRSPLTKAGQEAALATLPRTREIWATRLQLVKKGGER